MFATCKICERVSFGKIVHLGFDKWRHDHCEAGSPDWRIYYQRLDTKERTATIRDVWQCYQGEGKTNEIKSQDCHRSTSTASVRRKASVIVLGQTRKCQTGTRRRKPTRQSRVAHIRQSCRRA